MKRVCWRDGSRGIQRGRRTSCRIPFLSCVGNHKKYSALAVSNKWDLSNPKLVLFYNDLLAVVYVDAFLALWLWVCHLDAVQVVPLVGR